MPEGRVACIWFAWRYNLVAQQPNNGERLSQQSMASLAKLDRVTGRCERTDAATIYRETLHPPNLLAEEGNAFHADQYHDRD